MLVHDMVLEITKIQRLFKKWLLQIQPGIGGGVRNEWISFRINKLLLFLNYSALSRVLYLLLAVDNGVGCSENIQVYLQIVWGPLHHIAIQVVSIH